MRISEWSVPNSEIRIPNSEIRILPASRRQQFMKFAYSIAACLIHFRNTDTGWPPAKNG